MSTDLHTQLDEAIRAQLANAHAAARFGADWIASFYSELDEWRVRTKGGRELVADIYAHDDAAEAVANHIAGNDPWAIQRHCQRDLRVLERHQPGNFVPCLVCRDAHAGIDGGPCVEIRDLAVAYGLLDPTAGE